MQPGTLARSLLSVAIDRADPVASTIVEVLDAIPGAFERHEHGRADLPNAGPDPSRIAEPPHSRFVRPPADRRLRE